MYSPADFPSRLRAAPAKKRRLSAENGISSREAMSGLPTLPDSSCESSSACSSSTSASLWRSSQRSFGVFSSHSGAAACAASTARSTSSAPQRGTSAIVSPVAGAITSIVSPEAASANSPPIRILYCVAVVLMVPSLASDRWYLRRFDRFGYVGCTPPNDPSVAHDALRERHRYSGDDDDGEGHDVDDRQLLPLADVVEDPEWKRVLCACREGRHDHLVEGEREREQAPRDERSRKYGPKNEAERLPPTRAEILCRLDQRSRRPPQARDDVVVDDHDAEGRVADHDRPDRGLNP